MGENEKEELLKVGEYNSKYNDLLNIQLESLNIYRSKGLPAHMVKRKHYKSLKYIDFIPDIIENPDYVGVNPNESQTSIEIIKRYKDNIMIGIKLDIEGNYLYVSTVHDIQESKIERRLHSGRIRNVSIDNDENS
ncbi:hypothetical protein SAMN05443270_3007 [Lacrimispora sphenoides]|uniref:PBECR3 domain-containing polyvalent protein n=1 Tax=Lacrimispora sphenoides TaxID=29370 RepID=UPI0008AF99DE|nr:PBECR2 nuclease fold domain-containing protein [Lacrimispora sphenoides]SEU08193.1 hypothetical protein SAMN05443270_3007 [Lacrimispora sphenoides]